MGRTHTDNYEITYTIIDHDDDGQSWPEDGQPVLWWFKGMGCPPYCGSFIDDDFPGIQYFFAWCEVVQPPVKFFRQFNPEF